MHTILLTGTMLLSLATVVVTPALGEVIGRAPAASSQPAAAMGGAVGSQVAAQAAPPMASVIFNDPTGDEEAQNRIADHIRRAVDATPRHGAIRMAAYSFDRPDIAHALARACTRRQVSVQVVLNDNAVSPSSRRLRRLLGADADSSRGACGTRSGDHEPVPSFVKVCHASCRLGDRGNQHMKMYLFSASGDTQHVVMLGSANLTGYSAGVHWNDLVTFTGSQQLYDDYAHVFDELAADRTVTTPGVQVAHGDVTTSIAPGPSTTPDSDVVAARLARVGCHALPGTGHAGRTVVRIGMYGWQGHRGLDLARRVARLSQQGCRVQALVSAACPEVVETLLRAGVRVRSASLDVDGDVATGFEDSGWEHFVHEKWMSVDGTWDGSATRAVWTGSENWSDVSLLNDEVVVMIPRARVHDAYVAHFDDIWSRHSKKI
ncbi:phospholipase D-like domain-containing protein [Nocardioides renjunii]|uniref:phospholipase D-like domain-containing protein n=1 Tax=Nocardioides renjunii TaxID=3095075 RepID=UPI002AFEB809|nr:phospholipase D-like domain-containing protein [Nocardioides sp. S-34]WQQ21260.1 phospholipase D-like domain-containing protein [Nocardioides sp. S-34]